MKKTLLFLACIIIGQGSLFSAGTNGTEELLSQKQALEIGRRIWKNECAGTVDGLTSWNTGEEFASLGIGHFIWYPTGKTGAFEESFPALLQYFVRHGVQVPKWLLEAKGCPWRNRAEFLKDAQSPHMKELRSLLASTIPTQAQFAALRFQTSLSKMLAAAPAKDRDRIKANFERVAAEPMGRYALMDYVNFKGEGISPTEQYQGQGWGLLQVLQTMNNGPALQSFSQAAARELTQRVALSPKEKNELRWLPGWKNRCATYAE